MNSSSRESGIPVLTEVIPAPQPSLPAEEPVPASQEIAPQTEAPPPTPSESDDERWNRLEREVRERVLHQVLERIDFVLEQRVRDSLADVLQVAVEGLAAEIRSGLHHTVKDVVTRAVTQEITKLQSTKK